MIHAPPCSDKHLDPVSGALFCHLCARLCSASTTSVNSLKCTTSYHTTVAAFIMSRNCLNQSDSFCYACGEVTFKFQRKTFIPLIKKCYELYFGCNIGFFFFFLSFFPLNQQSEYKVFYELMCWLSGSLTYRLPNVMRSPPARSRKFNDC